MPDDFLSIESCSLGPLTILDRWYVCASNFDSLVYTIKERRRRRRRRRKKWENWLKGKATVICIYTRARNSSLHKHTLSLSSVVYMYETGRGHLFYDATRYLLHTLITCSINQSFLYPWVGIREKRIKVEKKKRFNFSINTEHCCCFI